MRHDLTPFWLCALAAVLAGLASLPAGAWPARTAMEAGAGRALLRPVAVFGADDRTALPPQFKDVQEKIGLLFNLRAHTVCTAFCVAPDIIATAGHCLHRTAGEAPPRLADFIFARNYEAQRDYTRLAGYANGTAAQFVMSGAVTLKVRPPIDAARDWALVRLGKPACSKGVLPVRAMPTEQVLNEAAAKRVFQIAYHRDFTPWKLAYSKPCAVERNFEAADWATIAHDFTEPGLLLLHTCDTGGASSGSPLLLETPTGPEVIGINVGSYIQTKVIMQNGNVTKRMKADVVANTGVSALAFAAKLDLFRQAVILTTPAQVRELQAALRQRQLYDGPVNGVYGPGLREAIEGYERAQGLTVTGLATQALLKRLNGTAAERGKAKARG